MINDFKNDTPIFNPSEISQERFTANKIRRKYHFERMMADKKKCLGLDLRNLAFLYLSVIIDAFSNDVSKGRWLVLVSYL